MVKIIKCDTKDCKSQVSNNLNPEGWYITPINDYCPNCVECVAHNRINEINQVVGGRYTKTF